MIKSKPSLIKLITSQMLFGLTAIGIFISPIALGQVQQTTLPLDNIATFAKVFETVKNHYVEDISDEKLLQMAIRGMIDGLDPHSALLDSREMQDLRIETTGKFGGLGIEITKENLGIRVISPIDDTPAHKAGIRAGDLIVRIENRPVNRMTLSEAVDLMRGTPGTSVSLTIIRDGTSSPLQFTLTRAVIKVRSVRSFLLEPNFGYLRITQFQSTTPEFAEQNIKKMLEDSPSLEGVVIDLRNNPGGELQSAIGISDMFIDDGIIVKTRGRNGNDDSVFQATPGDVLQGMPLVVLVNNGSASASEIVAGALQDHGRAVIMGESTFGKGSVQTILSVNRDTAVKLTTHRYFTPNDRSIQAQGIVPDIEVVRREFVENDEDQMLNVREADLEGSLENEDQSQQSPTEEVAVNPAVNHDYQLQQALHLLKGLRIISHSDYTG